MKGAGVDGIDFESFGHLLPHPDEVIIATGGLPHTAILSEGNELAASTWDIISGEVKPGSDVLIYDDVGDHAALQAAEVIAASGARLEILTRDRSFALPGDGHAELDWDGHGRVFLLSAHG